MITDGTLTPQQAPEYLGQESLLKYLRAKRGIPKSIGKVIVKDIVEFVICSISEQNRVHIPELGSFSRNPNPGKVGATVKFKPTQKMKDCVRSIRSMEGSEKSVIEYISSDRDVAPPSPSPKDLGKDRRNGENIIRSSFLHYLRHDFPFGKDWEHPLSNHRFSQQLIKEKLEFYKHHYPENYDLLYALWTTQKNREELSRRHKFSASTVQRRWNNAISCLLTLIMFPELEPSIPIQLYDVE